VNGSNRAIDLNADLGEGCPWDDPLLIRVSSASICCGAHAGDPATISHTLRLAQARGVVVGAHPGYADREGFGRREMDMTSQEVERLVREQVDALDHLTRQVGISLQFVKPHGALYNQGQRDAAIAAGIVAAVAPLGLPLVGQPGSQVERLCRARGHRFLAEGFADRRYQPDGRLVPRTQPNAILSDPPEIQAQVRRLVKQGIDTLCIHGDDPRSVGLADEVRMILREEGVTIWSFAG
jgi:UPF0271 protein